MWNHLGRHFKAARLAADLTLLELAQLTHYGRAKKTAGRIKHFERGGGIADELLARLMDALGVDLETVEVLAAQDRQEQAHLPPQDRPPSPVGLQPARNALEGQRERAEGIPLARQP